VAEEAAALEPAASEPSVQTESAAVLRSRMLFASPIKFKLRREPGSLSWFIERPDAHPSGAFLALLRGERQ
jgi:hypothetical protein